MVAATASGCVGVHLLAGQLGPCWAESAPQCILDGADEGGNLRAVRSQVPLAPQGVGGRGVASAPPQLLLLDVIELGLPPPQALGDAAGGSGAAAAVALLPDPAAGERLYCMHPSAAFSLRLPWLPVLADALAGAGSGRLPAVLPPPEVQALLECGSRDDRGRGGRAGGVGGMATAPVGLLGGAAVGDPLAGSALVVVAADGSPHCLRPKATAAATEGPMGAAAAALLPTGGASGVDREVEAQIERLYGDVLRGPKAVALPSESAGAGAGSPEGQRRLATSAAALRASHVEFQHQAAHDLTQRLVQLRSEAEQQARKARELAALADRAAGGGAALAARTAAAAALQANLADRLRLLAELHWSLPRPPSAAERRFQEEELPSLEAAAAALETEVKSLAGRSATVARRLRSLGDAAEAAVVSTPPDEATPPPAQLRRMREALRGQEALVQACMQRLAVLEGALGQHTEGEVLVL